MTRPHPLLVLASSGWGGTEKAVVDLANELASGGRVSIAIPPDAVYADRLAEAVEVHTLREGSRRSPWAVAHLSRLIRAVGPDVVHSHAARAAEMVFWARRPPGVAHVATKHNTRPRWIFSRIPCVTAVSEAARAAIRGRSDVTVVYDGVRLGPRPTVAKPDVFTLLGVGRLHRHKGFDLLIRAASELPFAWRLVLAGEGPERPALEGLIRDAGLGERVELLGHRDDVPSLLAGAHALVVTSRTEGFSLALIEGLHYADVVLSTPVGVAPEILPPELLLDPAALAQGLAAAHGRYDELCAITAATRDAVGDRFDLSRTVEAYLDVYRRALGT